MSSFVYTRGYEHTEYHPLISHFPPLIFIPSFLPVFLQVKRPPRVPAEVPETIEEWLRTLNLEDYTENFHQNGLYCPLAAVGLSKRDLQLMGVYMQGHRKKILLALSGLSQALFGKE